jgi:hypothetical protein
MIEDVPAGRYTIRIRLYDEQPPHNLLAAGERRVDVPPIPAGRSDEPLDVGKIDLRALHGAE